MASKMAAQYHFYHISAPNNDRIFFINLYGFRVQECNKDIVKHVSLPEINLASKMVDKYIFDDIASENFPYITCSPVGARGPRAPSGGQNSASSFRSPRPSS